MGACFDQKDIFPSIQQAIERLCKRKGEAFHEEIIDELLTDPEASAVIDRAVLRCPEHSRRGMTGIMVAWLSQRYSSRPGDLGDFSRRFERRGHGSSPCSYRPSE